MEYGSITHVNAKRLQISLQGILQYLCGILTLHFRIAYILIN